MEICCVMQGTNPAGHQQDTITPLVLSYLGFIKNAIDHAVYTLLEKPTKEVLIVGCYKVNFLYAYYSTQIL